MMRVVARDKFKGSLPATQVAAAIAAGLHAGRPGAEIVTIPVADGGEGTVDAAVAAGFERVPVTAAGPAGDPVRAGYARRGAGLLRALGARVLDTRGEPVRRAVRASPPWPCSARPGGRASSWCSTWPASRPRWTARTS
jgi:glycerate kinase